MHSFAKMQKTGTFSLRQICRYIYTDNLKYNISKQSKVLNKLMTKHQSQRDSFPYMINTPNVEGAKKQLSVHTKRRMAVLSKVFMERITDILSTGEIEPEILNRNIEISHVKVTADFKLINVFWIDDSPQELNTEELLQNCAFELRHQLSQLRIIGNVPPVQFVRLKGVQKIKEVEEKLDTLDCGNDHIPNTYQNAPYHIVTAPASSTNDEEQNILEDPFNISVPVMKHDIFGLDHYRIMSKIKISLNKARKVQNNLINTEPHIIPQLQSATNILTESEQKEQFSKFLNERQKEARRKLKKRLSKNNVLNDLEESNYEDDDDDCDIENDYNDFYDVEEDVYSDKEYK